MENPHVFREVHKLIFRADPGGKSDRVEGRSSDGLYNPVEYFYRLQKELLYSNSVSAPLPCRMNLLWRKKLDGSMMKNCLKIPSSPLRTPFYIVGEKILTKSERIPEDWPIFGTIGYVFLEPRERHLCRHGKCKGL